MTTPQIIGLIFIIIAALISCFYALINLLFPRIYSKVLNSTALMLLTIIALVICYVASIVCVFLR